MRRQPARSGCARRDRDGPGAAAAALRQQRIRDHPAAPLSPTWRRRQRIDARYAQASAGVVDFQKVTYRSSVGDMDIPAYVFQPLSKRGPRRHAALVWVHGGVHGSWWKLYPFVREAVERGYVVIAPEYRGSTGYGGRITMRSTTAATKSMT